MLIPNANSLHSPASFECLQGMASVRLRTGVRGFAYWNCVQDVCSVDGSLGYAGQEAKVTSATYAGFKSHFAVFYVYYELFVLAFLRCQNHV